MSEIDKAERILLINLGGIGDILLSLPAIGAICNHFSGAKITVLVPKRAGSILKFLPYVNEIATLSVNKRDGFMISGILSNITTLLSLRKKHFDLAVNMRTLVSRKSALKIKLLMNIISPSIKAGRDTSGLGNFFDLKIPETLLGDKSEAEYDMDLAVALGAKRSESGPSFKASVDSYKAANNLLSREGVSESDILIGIHPGGIPSRRWPIKNFISVIAKLSREVSATFVITGDASDKRLADKIMAKIPAKAVNFSGKTDFLELTALIKRCVLYISNDTGPMHIAALLKVPLIALFGPGYIKRYDPSGISDKVIVLRKDVDCAPCDKFNCPSLKCLKAISVDEVVSAALELLRKESKGHA